MCVTKHRCKWGKWRIKHSQQREAAKKVLFLVVQPLRGGAKGPTTKEKETLF